MRPPPDAGSADAFCWELCVAAILEVRVEEVIDCHEVAESSEPHAWWDEFARWLCDRRGRRIAQRRHLDVELPERPYIGVGPSPRSPDSTRHAVVAEGSEILYDPADYDEDLIVIDAAYELLPADG